MSEQNKTIIRLYYQPQTFPCGPNSSCCGPVGQSEEELQDYRRALEQAVPGVEVELVDVSQRLNMGRDLPVIKLLNSFGVAACPIFTVHNEVVSIGPPVMDELIAMVREKVGAPASGA